MNGLSNHFITSFLQDVSSFYGVFSANTIPSYVKKKPKFSIICNLSMVKEPGTHFVAITNNKRHIMIWDSLALNKTNFKKIYEFFKSYNISHYYKRPIQPIDSHFCGFYAIYHILKTQNETPVKPFVKKLYKNDSICISNIITLLK